MDLPSSLVDSPADEGARRLALVHLDAAAAARSRIATSADPEALHDYRVALRRLRSCLRSYRPELRSTVSRKNRRRLTRLARATNQSRDLEVHLHWLAAQEATAGDLERPGIAWLRGRLEEAQGQERARMHLVDERVFPRLDERLRRQLLSYPVTVRLDSPAEPPTTASAAARHLERAAMRLERRLERIGYETDEVGIHRARIATKHLRYLLEPFASDLPGGAALIDRLKEVQDAFGDVHDAHVFLPTLRSALVETGRELRPELGPGLRALVRSLRARALEAYANAARDWLEPGRRAAFFEDVRAAGQSLGHRRDGPPAHPSPAHPSKV
jgi:CHAD domain-containing protein